MHALLLLMTMLAPDPPQRESQIQALLVEIDQSGRVMDICEIRAKVEDPRKQIAPGQPPLLSFRYFQGADRHRFGKLDLMLDDAGH